MINTILFDLDGTLLPMDMESFLRSYFTELALKLKNHIPMDKTADMVMTSTYYMIKNIEANKTNKDAFLEDFKSRCGHELDEIMPVFDEFYKNEFKNVSKVVRPNPLVKQIVKNFKDKGYDLVVATNPLFPIEAILQRLQWADLDKEDFKLITCYERMHYCKPNLEYYEEILGIIGKKPEECMMVGNDVSEDMVSSKLGIKTFLIEDCIVKGSNDDINIDYKGSLEDLLNFSEEALAIK
jgi:FMN phosphatase YigB (HAD superfamily)